MIYTNTLTSSATAGTYDMGTLDSNLDKILQVPRGITRVIDKFGVFGSDGDLVSVELKKNNALVGFVGVNMGAALDTEDCFIAKCGYTDERIGLTITGTAAATVTLFIEYHDYVNRIGRGFVSRRRY